MLNSPNGGPQGSVFGVYGEEGSFLLRSVGQNTWFERVGQTFGRRSVDFDGKAGTRPGCRDMHDVTCFGNELLDPEIVSNIPSPAPQFDGPSARKIRAAAGGKFVALSCPQLEPCQPLSPHRPFHQPAQGLKSSVWSRSSIITLFQRIIRPLARPVNSTSEYSMSSAM